MVEFWLQFHWGVFLRVQLTRFQHWFRWWLGTEQVPSHCLNQWWAGLVMHIYVSWPQWDNSSNGEMETLFTLILISCTPEWCFLVNNIQCDFEMESLKRTYSHATLQWLHNERDGISNHQRLNCLLNRLFRRRSNKTLNHHITGLCEGNPIGYKGDRWIPLTKGQ